MTLGERIRAARERRGLTQEDVADKIGVLANTVSRWERDVCPPRGVSKKWLRANWPEVYAADDVESTDDDEADDEERAEPPRRSGSRASVSG